MIKSLEENGVQGFSLSAHDEKFHPNGYKDGDSCKFRDRLRAMDGVDDLSNAGAAVKTYQANPSANTDHAAAMDLDALNDAISDVEALEQMIASVSDPKVRQVLEDELKNSTDIMEKAIGDFSNSVKQINGGSASPGKQTAKLGPNPSIAHDESDFPSESDPAWQQALANYGGKGWHGAGSGSTAPHYIDFGGKRYFVKKAGYGKSTYTKAAVDNEVNANNFIRLAGFNAPDSKKYTTSSGVFSVTPAQDLSNGTLAGGLGNKAMREKVRAAYPLMALMYNMDLMQNSDNAFVGKDGNPLFLDNGSTFGFSAQGARNKYFDFDDRKDPFPANSKNGGLTGLLDVGNDSASVWKKALGSHSDKDSILKECAKYEMGNLVREAEKQGLLSHLPAKGVQSLKDYADKLDSLSKKYKTTPQAQTPAPTSASTPAPASAPSATPAPAPTPSRVASTPSSPATASVRPTVSVQNSPVPSAPSVSSQVSGGTMTGSDVRNALSGKRANSSWFASRRANSNSIAIQRAIANMNGLSQSSVNTLASMFTQGTFTPNGRGPGGTVTGLSIPVRGIQALQKNLNQAFLAQGLKVQIHNGGKSLSIGSSARSLAKQALQAAGLAAAPAAPSPSASPSTPAPAATPSTMPQPVAPNAPAPSAAGGNKASQYIKNATSSSRNGNIQSAYANLTQWLTGAGAL